MGSMSNYNFKVRAAACNIDILNAKQLVTRTTQWVLQVSFVGESGVGKTCLITRCGCRLVSWPYGRSMSPVTCIRLQHEMSRTLACLLSTHDAVLQTMLGCLSEADHQHAR